MAGVMQRDGIDAEPQLATCDVCRHRHACYIGGRALGTDAGPALWETHACLGCRCGPRHHWASTRAAGVPVSRPAKWKRAPQMHELRPIPGLQAPVHDTSMLEELRFERSPRRISGAQRERYELHLAEILEALGLDITTPATRDTPRRFLSALIEATDGTRAIRSL